MIDLYKGINLASTQSVEGRVDRLNLPPIVARLRSKQHQVLEEGQRLSEKRDVIVTRENMRDMSGQT